MTRKKKLIILTALAVLPIVIISASIVIAKKKPQTSTTGARGKQAVPVQTTVVQSGDISSVNTLTGTIAANLQTNVGAKIVGNVRNVNAEMGQVVHTGQVLAQLDPSDLQKQLAQLQAQVQVDEAQLPIAQNNSDQSKADYQRNETLSSSNVISKQQLEQSRLKMLNDQSQVQVTQAMLNKDQAAAAVTEHQIQEMTITSPVDGTVATKNIEVGEQVSTQTVLFNIAQIDPVKMTVNVSDQIIAGVQPGTKETVLMTASTGLVTCSSITAGVAPFQVQQDIQAKLALINFPSGYSWQFGGQATDMASSYKSLGLAMPLSIVLMYLVMAAQFESLFSPFIIMFSLPPTFVGVMLGLLVMRQSISVNALIGVIMLIGIVVNNAIVLVDYINQLRLKGLSITEAI